MARGFGGVFGIGGKSECERCGFEGAQFVIGIFVQSDLAFDTAGCCGLGFECAFEFLDGDGDSIAGDLFEFLSHLGARWEFCFE